MTPTEAKADLMSALRGFEQWDREGCRPYGYDHGQQSRHDEYHDHVERTDSPDVYSFRIQVFDSPDGDTWWRGKFRVIGGGVDVEIIEQQMEYR